MNIKGNDEPRRAVSLCKTLRVSQCQGRILKRLILTDPMSLNAAEGLFPSLVSFKVCNIVLHTASVSGCQNYPQSHANVK